MLLERYYDEALAQASYLIGCERSREAIVIDPNVVENYAERASMRGNMRIKYVTETHIHADFLSGSRTLARETGASLLLSGHGGADWSYRIAEKDGARLIRDGDAILIGKVRIDVLHTPGHTPEHLSFLVTDTASGDQAMGLVTGDFLFVGDVGRPDLLEKTAKVAGSMERSARELYSSLGRLSRFPDYLQIWPGHGAGSACGKALGSVPQSTLGYERLYNPALQHKTEDEFVRWVLADQPDPPPYFATMKRWNRDGRPEREAERGAGAGYMEAADVVDAIARGDQVVDTREPARFAREHVPGTINIPSSKSFATYAGTVLSYDRPIVVIGGLGTHALGTHHQLSMIGLEPRGYAKPDVIDEIKRGGHRMASVKLVDPQTVAAGANGIRVIDVRGTSEWNAGHLPAAEHVYLGDLLARADSIERDAAIVVHCQTGTRSSIAASLLMARGFSDVANLAGGFEGWRKAGLPVQRPR